jgi:HAD superfamily hydrolase (TIGR01509 family)
MRLLLDLAGVITRFDSDARLARLGTLTGLEPAEVRARVYGSGLVAAADAGEYDAAGFLAGLRAALGPGALRLGDRTLEAAWASAFSTDPEVLAVVAEVEATGVRVGVLSNNDALLTEVLPRELPEVFALIDAGVYFAGAIKAAKPDPRSWGTVLDAWQLPPGEVVFVDDKPEYAAAATEMGLHGVVFTTTEALVGDFVRLGLIPSR